MKCYPYHYHHTRILYSNKKHITSSSTSLTSSSLTSLSSSLLLENYNIDTDYDSIDNDNNFEQFLQALIIYKNIYGELIIPNKFQVPNESSWPNELHGFKLGKRLQRLLISDFFLNKYPDKKNALLQIGLNLSLDSLIDDWDMIYKALVTYKDIYGDLRVPNKFIIPREESWPKLCWDMKLGLKLSSIRSTGRYIKEDSKRKKQLDELGFEKRLRDHTHKQQLGEQLFEQIYDALVIYKENIDNELNVPESFIIPNNNNIWPENLWNLKLGEYIKSIKDKDKLVFGHEEREKRLRDLGLTFEESKKIKNSIKRFEMVCKALEVYKKLYGDLLVPQAFIVPINDIEWDEELWGLKLGARVNAIRSQGALVAKDQKRMDKLNDMGFVWELHNNNDKKKILQIETIIDTSSSTLLDYSRNYLNMDNKLETITQNSKEFSKSNGVDLFTPQSNNVMSYDPSLIYDTVSYREIAAESIREYMQDRELSNDPDIREIAHFEGKLTVYEYNKLITREISEKDIAELKRIGYRVIEFGRFYWEDVLEGFKIYKKIYGNLNVPKNFIFENDILEDNNCYHLQGLLLGEIVTGLRIGDIDGYEDPERRKILDELGFQWGDKDKYLRFRFIPMFLSLRIFQHLHGFCLPQNDFIIPNEPQWPYWMINMKLGKWASMARQQQKLLELHYPERYEMLQALGFLWWIPPGNYEPDLL